MSKPSRTVYNVPGALDHLVKLRQRPRIALARTIVALLDEHHVEIPSAGMIDPAQIATLPAWIVVPLISAGLLPMPPPAPLDGSSSPTVGA